MGKNDNGNNGRTELVFVVDRSGSMGGLESDTIGGFNSMLSKQRTIAGECRVTTLLFDHRIETLHNHLDIREVNDLTSRDYWVRGSTALLDAIGLAIDRMIVTQRHTAAAYRAQHVLFVIITDGYENVSRRYSLHQIKQMIVVPDVLRKCGRPVVGRGLSALTAWCHRAGTCPGSGAWTIGWR